MTEQGKSAEEKRTQIESYAIQLTNGYRLEGKKDGDYITVIRPNFPTVTIHIEEFIEWLTKAP
jgi:hypothetical protein